MDDGISGSVPGSIRWRSLSADQKGDKYQKSLCREEGDADESQMCLASAGGYLKTFKDGTSQVPGYVLLALLRLRPGLM